MLDKLFFMHDIKYIISVDDCFATPKRDKMKACVFSNMCASIEPFRELLCVNDHEKFVSEINDIINMKFDVSNYVNDFLEEINDEELEKYYKICTKEYETYTEERDKIINFLNFLQEQGIIEKYLTFSTTNEANIFDPQKNGMTNGAILWLIDRNFDSVGESIEAGLKLAENLVQKKDNVNKYIYILSGIDTNSQQNENSIEEEFDNILVDRCIPETHSFIYYINKQRLFTNKIDRIAKSFAQGFKRKVCYELFKIFRNCLSEALINASEKIKNVRQKTLNSLFINKVQNNGESYIDFVRRFVQIFYYDEYNKEISEKYNEIISKINYYEDLSAIITDNNGNNTELTDVLKEYREIELFNNHINKQHCEIATGDIFEIDGSFYLLVSQSCDTYLRKNGERKLEKATLLQIVDDANKHDYAYSLSCFNTMNNPQIIYHSLKIISFDILDLCVFNTSGEAMITIKEIDEFEEELKFYNINYRIRFVKVLKELKEINSKRELLKKFFCQPNEIIVEDVSNAYNYIEKIDPEMKNYDIKDNNISFNIRRICRLNELTTIDIIKKYGSMLSRIGHPFDFIK